MKAVKAWAVVTPLNGLMAPAMRTRVETIKQWAGPEDGWRNRWRWCQRQGCRIVRVTITAEEAKK